MKPMKFTLPIIFFALLTSCSIFERSSRHGFESGYYHYRPESGVKTNVYLDIWEDSITGYPVTGKTPGKIPVLGISLQPKDTLDEHPAIFGKNSVDIDITTILFKYRPGIQSLPAQLSTDFNAALFAGWRHDHYHLEPFTHPFRHDHYEAVGRGFDVGIFAGTGTTPINPFTTKEAVVNEYSSMILQYGIAGFIESNVASFGISFGYDYLLSPDRKFWIYHQKPWFGFIVGIALN
jgi:hypothetical protein